MLDAGQPTQPEIPALVMRPPSRSSSTIMLCMIKQIGITSRITVVLHVLAGCQTIAHKDCSILNARSASFLHVSYCLANLLFFSFIRSRIIFTKVNHSG
jgi:hypothetical protein